MGQLLSMAGTTITITVILVSLIASVVSVMMIIQYYKIHTKTIYMNENINDVPGKERYVVAVAECDVYEHPSLKSHTTTYLPKNSCAMTNKYKVGFYFIPAINGWVDHDDVAVYKSKDEIDLSTIQFIGPVDIKKYRFRLQMKNDLMDVYIEPTISSRKRNTVKNTKQIMYSNQYMNDWFYIDSVNGWVHESNLDVFVYGSTCIPEK